MLVSKFLLLAALVTVFTNWVNTNGENLLFRVVQESLTFQAQEQGIAEERTLLEFIRDGTTAFYGNFFFWVNIVAMLLQAFVFDFQQVNKKIETDRCRRMRSHEVAGRRHVRPKIDPWHAQLPSLALVLLVENYKDVLCCSAIRCITPTRVNMNSETFLACLNSAGTLSQFVSRMSLLSALSANSALRSSIESSLLSLRAGNQALCGHVAQPSLSQSVEAAVSLMRTSNEKALSDWRNQVQSVILMQDEAAVWAHRMGERLEAIRHAATRQLPGKAA